jgi:hypothetical protein
VRALTDTFEAQVTQLFTGYVGALLQVRPCACSASNSSYSCVMLAAAWGHVLCDL